MTVKIIHWTATRTSLKYDVGFPLFVRENLDYKKYMERDMYE